MNPGQLFTQIAERAAAPVEKARAKQRQADQESAGRGFLERNAEIFASLDQAASEVDRKISAFIRLRDRGEVARLLDHSLPEHVRAGQLGDEALLVLLERGALTFALNPLPPEAQAALQDLKRRVELSGLRPPTTKPPIVATAEVDEPSEEDLDKAAIAYYRVNSTTEVKARMRREPDFAKRVIRLQETNKV